MSTTTTTLAELSSLEGKTLGTSEWIDVTQDRVNLFADATDDHQWIHVDVDRANVESPFGGPIGHGYLTLSADTDVVPGSRGQRCEDLRQLRAEQGPVPRAGAGRIKGAAYCNPQGRRGGSRRAADHGNRRGGAGRRFEAGVHRRTGVPLTWLIHHRRPRDLRRTSCLFCCSAPALCLCIGRPHDRRACPIIHMHHQQRRQATANVVGHPGPSHGGCGGCWPEGWAG